MHISTCRTKYGACAQLQWPDYVSIWCESLCAQDGWTALHLASQEGHADVVRVLIEANAYINQQNKVIYSMHAEHMVELAVCIITLQC